MGTPTHFRKLTDGDVIPWKFVPHGVWHALVVKLNPDMPCSGNDWRMLASKLGYTQGEIKFIESEKDTNTNLLFKMYSQRQESSVNEIYTCLEEMGRRDCLEIIDKAYEDMKKIAKEKSHTRPDNQGSESSEYIRYPSNAKCPIHASDVHVCTSYCSCLCSPFISPSLQLPPMSHRECPSRTAALMCLINNGTFAFCQSPQHSLTTDHGCLVHSQQKQPIHDMVPAFRTKRVFVTYSKDNKNHAKEVLSLCNFFLKHGIACYVDGKEADVSLDWCTKKMFEADFILVCVSPKYLQDVGLCDSLNYATCQQGTGQQLHTKEIYARMESQCCNANCANAAWRAKIVPVMFGGMSAAVLPRFMISQGPSYAWPNQHKELIVKLWDVEGMRVKKTSSKNRNNTFEPSKI